MYQKKSHDDVFHEFNNHRKCSCGCCEYEVKNHHQLWAHKLKLKLRIKKVLFIFPFGTTLTIKSQLYLVIISWAFDNIQLSSSD